MNKIIILLFIVLLNTTILSGYSNNSVYVKDSNNTFKNDIVDKEVKTLNLSNNIILKLVQRQDNMLKTFIIILFALIGIITTHFLFHAKNIREDKQNYETKIGLFESTIAKFRTQLAIDKNDIYERIKEEIKETLNRDAIVNEIKTEIDKVIEDEVKKDIDVIFQRELNKQIKEEIKETLNRDAMINEIKTEIDKTIEEKVKQDISNLFENEYNQIIKNYVNAKIEEVIMKTPESREMLANRLRRMNTDIGDLLEKELKAETIDNLYNIIQYSIRDWTEMGKLYNINNKDELVSALMAFISNPFPEAKTHLEKLYKKYDTDTKDMEILPLIKEAINAIDNLSAP